MDFFFDIHQFILEGVSKRYVCYMQRKWENYKNINTEKNLQSLELITLNFSWIVIFDITAIQ